jgi:acyl-CoA dehydrogenase
MCDRLQSMTNSYALERKQFGKTLSEFQLVQGMIADSQVDALAATGLMDAAARKYDNGEVVTLEAAAAKYFASEAVGRIADRAVQIHGGAGYMAEYKVERFYRDVRLLRIYEGASQIQQVIISREVLKRAAQG